MKQVLKTVGYPPIFVLSFALLFSTVASGCASSFDLTALGFQGMAGVEAIEAGSLNLEPATATVTTRSLRVRKMPWQQSEIVAGVSEGDVYPVTGLSSDGMWVQIELDSAQAESGWVGAGFVTVKGDITDAEILDVSTGANIAGSAASGAPNDQDEFAGRAQRPPPGFARVASGRTPLRVRSAPTTKFDNKIGNVFNGEVYRILGVTDDGAWLRIAVPQLDAPNGGWVSADFMVFGSE